MEINFNNINTDEGKKEIGKLLIEKYPWLNEYHNAYLYDIGNVDEATRKRYDGRCILFNLPIGWLKAFGLKLCEEIRIALEKDNIPPQEYKMCQIKLKWGYLCWYAEGGSKTINDIIQKYEILATKIDKESGEEIVPQKS